MSHLVLVGPTASGKSEIAAELADHLPGPPVELVSVDSMQVYRGMDIGTAKPTEAEQTRRRHHLIDLADPSDDFSLTRFAAAAAEALAAVEGRGHRALLVGGTGLYVQAIVDELDPPPQYPDVRRQLEADEDTDALYLRLVELDATASQRTTANNRRRIIRALEVTLGSGKPFSSHGPGIASFPPTNRFRLAGIWLPRSTIGHRIEQRFTAMLDAGLRDEVQQLASRPPGLSRTARQALGY
jgi:tRNA dimethylallyltransferase